MTNESEEVLMEIKGLMLDPSSNVPIVILKDAEDSLFLPIWIGVFEANAIALRVEGIETPRPMTHDLVTALLKQLEAKIDKIVVCDLQENTFFARIHLNRNGEELEVDSRPSDAIALAVRSDAPIHVLRPVLEKAQAIDLTQKISDDEKLRKWLEEVSPEDLGKYTM